MTAREQDRPIKPGDWGVVAVCYVLWAASFPVTETLHFCFPAPSQRTLRILRRFAGASGIAALVGGVGLLVLLAAALLLDVASEFWTVVETVLEDDRVGAATGYAFLALLGALLGGVVLCHGFGAYLQHHTPASGDD